MRQKDAAAHLQGKCILGLLHGPAVVSACCPQHGGYFRLHVRLCERQTCTMDEVKALEQVEACQAGTFGMPHCNCDWRGLVNRAMQQGCRCMVEPAHLV